MSTGSVKATGQLRQWEKENCKYNGIPFLLESTQGKYFVTQHA